MSDLFKNLPREIMAPVKGERMVFRITAEDTNGTYTEFDHFIAPGQGFSPTHMHETQTQKWEVVSGTAAYLVEGVEKTAKTGDRVVIPPGKFHIDPYNQTGSDELHLRRTISPEGGSQLFFTTWFVLACADSFDLKHPGYQFEPLPIAVLVHMLPAKSYTTDLPVWMQKIAIPVGALVGWLLGKRARYPELEQKYFATK
ncbi:MAG: cupin domain-containing protein [Anaerolineae bacterium]|nr:cupin domain-containing protein [Anaerolineae bacterium]